MALLAPELLLYISMLHPVMPRADVILKPITKMGYSRRIIRDLCRCKVDSF